VGEEEGTQRIRGRFSGGLRLAIAIGAVSLISAAVAATATRTSASVASAGGRDASAQTLTVWLGGILAGATPGSVYRKWYDKEVAAFKLQHPGVTVKTVLMNPDGVQQLAAYRAAFGAHRGPDVGMMYPAGFTTTFSAALQNLRAVAPKVVKQFPTGQLQYGCPNFDCTGNAPVYQVPFDWSGWVFAYNKTAFAKAGVKAPFKSWSALMAAGTKLKAAGYTPFEIGNRQGYFADAWLSAMESSYLSSHDIVNFLAGKLKLTDAKFVQPLTVWANLYKSGLTNANACTVDQLAAQNPFFAGKAATVASYEYSKLYQQMHRNVGVMPFPPVDGAPRASHAGTVAQVGQGWTITKDTSNLPLSVAFVGFITSPAAQTAQFQITGDPPANPKSSFSKAPDPISAAAAKGYRDFAILSLDTVMPLQTQVAYFKETALALCGKEAPTQAMQHVQAVFDRERKHH
jgi:ABC-type glycerol-3-phosphate transport system substrate-binding protein